MLGLRGWTSQLDARHHLIQIDTQALSIPITYQKPCPKTLFALDLLVVDSKTAAAFFYIFSYENFDKTSFANVDRS